MNLEKQLLEKFQVEELEKRCEFTSGGVYTGPVSEPNPLEIKVV